MTPAHARVAAAMAVIRACEGRLCAVVLTSPEITQTRDAMLYMLDDIRAALADAKGAGE